MSPPEGGTELQPASPGELESAPPEEPESAPARPGASTFTIEGRAAPALFVVGWIASLLGLGAIAIALAGGANPAAPFLLLVGLLVSSVGLVSAAGSQGIERRARGVPGYQGPSPFLVFAAALPVSYLLGSLAAVPLSAAGVDLRGPMVALLSIIIQALVYIALIRLLVVDAGAFSWADMGLRRPDQGATVDLLRGALWAVPVIAVTVVVAGALARLVPVTPASPLPPTGDDVGLLVNLLAGAVIAPVAEEILFRGFATTAWARSMGAGRGLVRAALFFAVVHVLTISGSTAGEAAGLALVGFASRIPVALALGWLFLRRGSLWAPIGLHATFNAILIVLGEFALRSGVG